MKYLLKSDLLYYVKNKTKLVLSIAFIFSFLGIIFLYDNLELSEIKKEYQKLRYYPVILNHEFTPVYDLWNNYENKYGLPYNFEDSDDFVLHEFWSTEYGIQTKEKIEALDDEVYQTTDELREMYTSYATLHAGGRMNVELTLYRQEINRLQIKLYELFHTSDIDFLDDNFLAKMDENRPYFFDSYDNLLLEKDRLQVLGDTSTPDDFNYYTITNSNYLSKVFEGLSLFIILVFILALFYDLFSKDFVTRGYITLFSSPYPRSKIILSKLLFGVLYSLFLITIGITIASLYMFIQTRIGYNIVPKRHGYILHPVFMNTSIFSFLTNKVSITIVPMLFKNIVSLITGISLIGLWISIINYISFKLKSSSSTLTIGVFALLAVFFINFTPTRTALSYVFPIFAYNFDYILKGEVGLNFIYLIVLSIILSVLLNKYFFKDILTTDILDGDSND